MTKQEKKIAAFSVFSDEQLQAEHEQISALVAELHSTKDRIARELKRRRNEKQVKESAKCGGGK